MQTRDIAETMAGLFGELANGTGGGFGPFMLNTGDVGLMRGLPHSARRATSSTSSWAA